MRALQTCQHDLLPKEQALIVMLETKIFGLDCIKELYEKDLDFSEHFSICVHSVFNDFFRHDGFLFKGKRLCIPMSSIRQLLMKEAHEGGLMGCFGELKTVEILSEHFHWPHMRKNVHNICERFLTCKLAKSKVSPRGLYTPLPIPTP
ncbi:hypothetical protein CR513_59135, partial [Mucuna pruriens]